MVSLAAERDVRRDRADQEDGRVPVTLLSPETAKEVSLVRVDHSLGRVPAGRVSL